MALQNLAMVAFERGDRERGVQLARETASVSESLGDTWWRAVTLFAAAEYLVAANDPDAAEREFLDGVAGLASVGDQVNLPIALGVGAALAAQQGDAARAGTLWGALEAVAEREPKRTSTQALRDYAPHLEPVQGAEFEQGRARGRGLSLDEAVAHALSRLDSPR
jgi:hypothetical protein